MKHKQLLIFGILNVGVLSIMGALGYKLIKNTSIVSKETDTYRAYYRMVTQWLNNIKNGISVYDYFKDNDYKRIGVYGMGSLGNMFLDEIEKTDIDVACIIDKNSNEMYEDEIPIIFPEDISSISGLDVIIVTPVNYYDEILKTLEACGSTCKIVSLEEVIMGK